MGAQLLVGPVHQGQVDAGVGAYEFPDVDRDGDDHAVVTCLEGYTIQLEIDRVFIGKVMIEVKGGSRDDRAFRRHRTSSVRSSRMADPTGPKPECCATTSGARLCAVQRFVIVPHI